MSDPSPTTQSGPGRIDAVDAARGLALAVMAAYHTTWDLGFLQLTPFNAALTPAGRWAAHAIAGSFLLLVGVGLVLADRDGVRWRPFARRLLRIGLAALAITAATRLLFPESYIFFGVLHCIALSSVLALPFLALPPAVTALAAAAVLAAPAVSRALVPGPSVLDAPALLFLGLGHRLPDTNDWVPLFPWFGMVLAGVALARLGLPALRRARLGNWRARGGPGRFAVAAGRHSLAVYLVHQPLLLAVLYGMLALTGPHPRAGERDFRAEFQGTCTRSGGNAESCRIAGRCIAGALRREGLWGIPRPYGLEQRSRAQAIARTCYQAAEGTMPPP